MANNIGVSVTADVTGLQAGMTLAKVAVQDYGKAAKAVAREINAGDTTVETRKRYLELSEAQAKATATAALYDRQLRATQATSTAANDNAGQLRAGFQNLGYQLQDISVQFAGGQRAATIFAQQLPQVAGALTMIAQAGGNTTGAMGRLATFMSGPWGVAVGVAAAVLPPLISKLLETGDAADGAAAALDRLIKKRQEERSDQMTLPDAQKAVKDLEDRRAGLVDYIAKHGVTDSKGFVQFVAKQQAELAEVNRQLYAARNAVDAERGRALGTPSSIAVEIERDNLRSEAKESRPKRSRGVGDSGAKAAARAAEEQARAEVAAKLAANEQIFALDEDRYRTEAALSQIALRAKLSDIDAEQRAGAITGAQAIQAKANVDDQIEALDEKLQARLFLGKIKQLEADRSNYAAGTAEYERYTRQIELLQQQHLNRQLVLDQTAQARAHTAEKQARAANQADEQRAEEQKRAALERSVAPFAQSLARMLTLQRSFIGTVRDLWGSLVGGIERVIAQMITSWLVGLAAQEAASDAADRKQVIKDANAAARGAYKAVAGIPIVGPILAPIAAAAAYAGVVAFSAEDGWDVPGGAGAGIDGRGGRPAIIHPREMVLPANIAEAVRAIPNGIAATASLRGASASVAAINTGTFSSPRINGGFADRGNAARQSSDAGDGPVHLHLHGEIIQGHRDLERWAQRNGSALAAGVRKAFRDGYRG